MSTDVLTHLLVNVGLAATLVVWFVYQNSDREKKETQNKTELEKFIRVTLLKIIEDNSALLRENQIILSKCVDVIEAIESDENTTD